MIEKNYSGEKEHCMNTSRYISRRHVSVLIAIAIVILSTCSHAQNKSYTVALDSSYMLQYPSLYFGTLCPGQAIDLPFTIQNISQQTFTIVELSTSSPFSVLTPTTPLSLVPGEVQPIQIRFTAIGKGNFSAPFVIRLANRSSADTLTLRGNARDNSIAISDSALDFGDLPVNRTNERTFTVTNTGSDTIQIGLVDVLPIGSPFVVLSPSFPQSLPKGASILVRVQFRPITTGSVSPNATIHVDLPCADTKRVRLIGRGIRGNLSFSRSSILYPDAWCITESKRDSISVTNTGTDTVSVFSASITGQDQNDFKIISSPPLPLLLKSNDRISFVIDFIPQVRGLRNAILTITSADVDNPVKDIALTGSLRTAVFVSNPSAIAFGDVRIGVVSDLSLFIQNPNPVGARIIAVRFDPPDPSINLITPFPQSLSSQGAALFIVRYLPGSTKDYNGVMHLYFDTPCADSISIPISGRGIQGEAKISWSGLPATLKCSSASNDVTIENAGTASFDINSFFIEGRDSFLFQIASAPPLPATLAPGKNVTVTIRFTPTAPPNGLKIGLLGFTLSGASVDTLRVNLSAERINPVITNTNIDFGVVDLRASSIQTLELRNTESTTATVRFIDIQPSEFQYRGQPGFTLQQSSSFINLPVEFSPKIEASFTGSIRFVSEPCSDTIVVSLIGIGRRCRVTTQFAIQNEQGTSDTLTAMMGQKLVARIVAKQSPGNDNVSSLTFILTYNKTLLIPISVSRGDVTSTDNVQYIILFPGVMQITITSSSTIKDAAGTIALIEFTAVLGDELQAPIDLTLNAIVQKCFTTTSLQRGYFILQGACEERRGEKLRLLQKNTLWQNSPNPFSAAFSGTPSTTITYDLVKDCFADLSVFNIFGQKIATLVHANQSAKRYTVEFDASQHERGLYLYILQAGEEKLTRKMLYLK